MSMSNHPVEIFGMMIADEEAKQLTNQLYKQLKKENALSKGITKKDVWDIICTAQENNLLPNGEIEWFTDDSSDNMRLYISPNIEGDKSDTIYPKEQAIVFAADHEPELFKAAYNSPQELINEYKEKIGKYFPEFTDNIYLKHIGYFSCSEFS